MEPRRYLRCLGQPGLFTPTGEPIRFRTKKHLALLVYLAVDARHSHRRDRLGELLWPKVTLAEARHSLATALSILRPRLGPEVLESTRDQVVLTPGRIALDLDRLAAGDVLGSEVTGPLEVAAFLEGFEIPDASEFALWKDRQQARLLPAIKDALIALIDRCRRTGDSRQIEQLADRMLGLDELSEEAIRAKMEARAFAGDRLTALRIFEEWKDKLAEELGAAPSSLVEGMAVRLRRRGWERTTLTHIPTVPTDQWRGRPFIGRSSEYRALYEGWEGMRKGVPGHAMVLGDSGVGKTTLVERLTTAAGLEGAAISRVQCYDLEREIPYATLGSLIHGLLDRPGVSATPPEALAELARTVPEVRRRFASIPPPSDSQGETARIRLTESFHQMLQAIAEEHPVILVVDDLHLADDASLAVLHLVMRRARSEAIMMLLIARPGELPGSLQAARLRETAAGLGIREVELNPLSEEDSRELLASLVPPEQPQPSASVRRTLLRAAGGFPMVLELLVQDWQTNGDQSLALAVDAMTAELGGGQAPPAVYRQVLDRIVRAVDPVTHSVLNLAAILGHRLNELGMYALADLTIGQTMAGMAELVRRRVLRDGGQGLEFVNEVVRAAAYLGVPSSLRALLHSHIADQFIQEEQAGSSALGLEIAWHCIRAGRTHEATPYLLRGARDARNQGAVHAAERGLSTALSHLLLPERKEAVILLAEVLQDQGEWSQLLVLLDREFSATEREASSIARILTMMAKSHLFGYDAQAIDKNLRFVTEVIESNSAASVRIAAARMAAFFVGDLRDSTWARKALDAVSSIQAIGLTTDELSRIALAKAILLFQLHDKKSSLGEIEAAAAFLDERKTASSIACHLQAGLGAIRCMEGEYSSALTPLRNAYTIATRLDNDTLRSDVAANVALAYGRLGDYDQQLHWALESIGLSNRPLSNYTQLLAVYCAAFAFVMKGKALEGVDQIARVESGMPGTLPVWVIQAWSLYSADVFCLAGRATDARKAALRGTLGDNAKLHVTGFVGPYSRWLAKLAESPVETARAHEAVTELHKKLSSYDALDRAEVLCTMLDLESRLGLPFETTANRLREALLPLPPAVALHLKRLGFLQSRGVIQIWRNSSHW